MCMNECAHEDTGYERWAANVSLLLVIHQCPEAVTVPWMCLVLHRHTDKKGRAQHHVGVPQVLLFPFTKGEAVQESRSDA